MACGLRGRAGMKRWHGVLAIALVGALGCTSTSGGGTPRPDGGSGGVGDAGENTDRGTGGAGGDGGGAATGGTSGAGGIGAHGGAGPGGGGSGGGGSGGGGSGGSRDGGMDAVSQDARSFACQNLTCGPTQVCIIPCCGGAPPLCVPLPDGSPCNGTQCFVKGSQRGCAIPCTPPAPYCADPPAACGSNVDCNCLGTCCGIVNERQIRCTCA